MAYGFQHGYMNDIEPTLGNLVARSGFSFFFQIKGALQNFGLQSLLCHYLTSDEGWPIFNDIVAKISDLYSYDFMGKTQEYGIFVSGKDFRNGEQFINEHNPVLLGYDQLQYRDAVEKVSYADLCILLKSNTHNIGLLGEVEGNNGGELLLKSFWAKKKGEYYSFGIGVNQRSTKTMNISSYDNYIAQPIITGQWVKTECGWKYVVVIESDHSIVSDFHDAIGTIQTLMTLGHQQRANYDPSLIPVLSLIKRCWDSNIVDLIAELRSMLISNATSTLGINPLPSKFVPSIAT